MIIHFICRGNAFRSIIAEAYLNSLKIKDLSVLSSGTAAIVHKARNLANHRMTLDLLEEHGIREFAKSGYGDQLTQSRLDKADITVCMNQRVYDECLECVTFPASPRVWSVADIGEPGRISDIELERQLYRAEAYQEIVRNVERLVSDVLDGQTRLTLVACETRALTGRSGRRTGRRPVAQPHSDHRLSASDGRIGKQLACDEHLHMKAACRMRSRLAADACRDRFRTPRR